MGLRKTAPNRTTHAADNNRSALFVTRYILAPGAPLHPPIEGQEVLIIGIGNGELSNEKKSPQRHVRVTSGLVMVMPKEEGYLLRNVGKQSLELLLVEVRK
jgi:mannose-6-phosphate isomerase-like protein (cupin superfamily)